MRRGTGVNALEALLAADCAQAQLTLEAFLAYADQVAARAARPRGRRSGAASAHHTGRTMDAALRASRVPVSLIAEKGNRSVAVAGKEKPTTTRFTSRRGRALLGSLARDTQGAGA